MFNFMKKQRVSCVSVGLCSSIQKGFSHKLLLIPVSSTHSRLFEVLWVRRLARCSFCVEIDSATKEVLLRSLSVAALRLKQFFMPNPFVENKLNTTRKKVRARLYPDQYCSIIIDGASQSAFELPHFTILAKYQRGHTLKVMFIGILQHMKQKSFVFVHYDGRKRNRHK